MLGRIGASLKYLGERIGWARSLAGVLLIAFLALRVWDPLPLELLRLKFFDIYQVIKPREINSHPVVIVDIDEESLELLGQWPWPRDLIADLVDRIMSEGALAIAFDIVFPEPDRTSPDLMADKVPGLSEPAKEELRKARNHDAILAESLRRSRVVLGQSAYNPRGLVLREGVAPKAPLAYIGQEPGPFLLTYPELLPNIKTLEDAASGRGMLTVLPEADGVVRRAPLIVRARDTIIPALSIDVLRVAAGQSTLLVKSDSIGVRSIVVAGAEVPTDPNGQLWIYFSPHDPLRFVSAKDVMEGRVDRKRLENKFVLIGTSASGLFDLKTTPTEPVMAGVEVQAQVLENILSKSVLNRPGYAVGAEVWLALLVGLAIIFLVPVFGAFRVFTLGFAITLILASVSWQLYSRANILFDVAFPLISSFGVFLALVFTNYFREEAQRQQIRNAFNQYLSPDLVEDLAKNPDKLVLGGETRDMTILFTDVRGFTAISELYRDDPQGLTALMNRFLTPLSNAIIDNNGTIDKYMGDSIMAFWNAPLDNTEHAIGACKAALDMLNRMERVNAERAGEAKQSGQHFIPIKVGIGINTGECVVGNIGSELRFDYSVLGDSVNLASRLEGQSKAYGVPIIIGSQTANYVEDEFAMLELDFIRVKGKSEPDVIYTILGGDDLIMEGGYVELRDRIQTMLNAYRHGDWGKALVALQACKRADDQFGLETFYNLYGTRIAAFLEAPPPDWDGVFTLETK
jgi:adenylate cyclase